MSKKLSQVFKIAQKIIDSQDSSRQQGQPRSNSGSGSSLRSTIEGAISQFGGGGSRPSGGAPGYPGQQPQYQQPQHQPQYQRPTTGRPDPDQQAIARYDYLMQTADPHQVEQIHAEAFARLTPAQREAVQRRMQTDLPPHEQPRSAGVSDLSRAAARSEARRPGSMRSVLAKVGTGGAVAAAGVGAVGVLGAVAAGAAVSSVAGPLLADAANLGVDFDAIASGIDVEGLTSGLGDLGAGALGDVGAGVEDLAAQGGDAVSGLGDSISGAGQSLSDLAGGFDPRDLF